MEQSVFQRWDTSKVTVVLSNLTIEIGLSRYSTVPSVSTKVASIKQTTLGSVEGVTLGISLYNVGTWLGTCDI
jgi:hypothetical protein